MFAAATDAASASFEEVVVFSSVGAGMKETSFWKENCVPFEAT
jgi:hypothetical protein